MDSDLYGVKIESGRPYHHGALKEALIEAAEAVLAERGVDGFSLREAARRAGVSPAAPGHHFRDARGLLTAVAARAFRDFGAALEVADVGPDREERLRSQGRAYVAFALGNRARFELMWRRTVVDGTDPELAAAGERAFAILDRVVRGEGATRCRPNDPAAAASIAASIAAWSLVHGFARLAMDGVFGTDPGAPEAAAEALLPRIFAHLRV